MTLKVVENVEPLHPGQTPQIANLYDRLHEVIVDYVRNSTAPVTAAEVVGTLEFLKLAHMHVYDE